MVSILSNLSISITHLLLPKYNKRDALQGGDYRFFSFVFLNLYPLFLLKRQMKVR